jgi:hypothetical protein
MESKIKYFVINHDTVLGTFWETEKLGNVLVMTGNIDLNFPIQIVGRDETGNFNEFKEIDIVKEFMNILDINLLKKENNEKSS